MSANQATYPIRRMSRVLEVSASGFYAWRKRPPSKQEQEDEMLTQEIKKIHQRSKGTYGSPRMHAELAEQGLHVGCKRVARLMQAPDLRGVSQKLDDLQKALERKPRLLAVVHIDAVQYAPHGPIGVQKLDCDFLISSAYKFLGPHSGILYGTHDLLEKLFA